jgi:hypothetical protein
MLLHAEPENPAQYFAACGFFELASHLQPDVKAVWQKSGLEFLTDDSLFTKTIKLINRLTIQSIANWPGKNSICPFDLCDSETQFSMRMDWWEQRNSSKNTPWKCFGGQLQAAKLSNSMLTLCKSIPETTSPKDLFNLHIPSSSRLGFDPRSSWNRQDAGFSPNEHKQDKKVATFQFTEFLSSIALQSFPFQTDFQNIQYSVWHTPFMIAMARITASSGGYGTSFTFNRSKRGSLLTFNYSRPITD